MQALKLSGRASCRNLLCATSTRRYLSVSSVTANSQDAQPTEATTKLPWFIDPSEVSSSRPGPSSPSQSQQQSIQHQQLTPLPPLPPGVSPHTPIGRLRDHLSGSPFLEPGALVVQKPIPTEIGPPLPASAPKGRRKRGRSYVGEGMGEEEAGLWQWIVLAQVKEGTENRGAIESVVRQVRQSLLKEDPPVPLPPRRRLIRDGWAMIDAGDFAVHIVSKSSGEKFFPERRTCSPIQAVIMPAHVVAGACRERLSDYTIHDVIQFFSCFYLFTPSPCPR